MYPVKKNVLITIALLKAYGFKEVVISPGSRNAPLIQCFSQDPFFTCRVIVDERAAAFYALGIIQCRKEPVVICCTSGTALLNYAPAVAEAFYQQLPLIVLSADRTPEWIGQMDGQTLPQAGCFGALAKRSVQLPEINTETEAWHAERLVNEALLAATKSAPGPVHINIPIGEPLFDYSETRLPEVKRIRWAAVKKQLETESFADRWNQSRRRLLMVGQYPPGSRLSSLLEALMKRSDCVVLAEHTSNCTSPSVITNFDALLYALEEKEALQPDLVISLGGHIVSKRIKQWLRKEKPSRNWFVSPAGEVVDLYQSLTDVIGLEPEDFVEQLTGAVAKEEDKPYQEYWKKRSTAIEVPGKKLPFSDLSVTGRFLERLPRGAFLHLANSSSVRNAQLYALDSSIQVYSNRGTNGIESTLPTAVGFASVTDRPVYLLIGDLSFFYSVNSLWNIRAVRNLRILLLNNGGGGIFHVLPGLNKTASLEGYVAAGHQTDACLWAEAAELKYVEAVDEESLKVAFTTFFDEASSGSILLEVKTEMACDKKTFQAYYHQLKDKI